MSSPFKSLLMGLQDWIGNEIPYEASTRVGIRESNQDVGQIDAEGVRPAVAFPWCGIDFSETKYDQKQFKVQWAKANISFRLAFDPWGSSSSLAPDDVRENALAYYETEDLLYLKLQDWRYEYEPGKFLLMIALRRISAITEQRKDVLRVRKIVFECTFEDRGLQALQP